MRLTLEMDTPDGVKSGSSVIEAKSSRIPHWLAFDQQGLSVDITGEAVFIDLGQGKNAALLLTESGHDKMPFLAPRAFDITDCYSACSYHHEWTEQLSGKIGQSAVVKVGDIPRLITLIDSTRPETAKIIYATANQLEKMNGYYKSIPVVTRDVVKDVLGEGFGFRKLSVEITDSPVQHTLEDQLPWLRHFKKTRIGTRQAGHVEVPINLPKVSFIRKNL